MSIGAGSYIDHYVRKFTDMLEHDVQQRGSRLRGLVTIERGMGDKVYFDKIGALSSYIRTSRYEDKQIANQVFERRFCTPQTIEFNAIVDEMDLQRYAMSPQSDLVQAGSFELGRQLDDVIIAALSGTANRELAGAASNVAFDSNNNIAVNVNTYTALSGDTALHEGKLLVAKRILQANHIDLDREDVFVVAPAKQLANLHSRAIANGHMLVARNVEIDLPGLDKGLDGFLGLHFIASERLGVDGSADQYVYIFPRSAIKLGIWKDLAVDIHKRHDLASDPTEITANMTIGAVRMFEEKVVRCLGDPT